MKGVIISIFVALVIVLMVKQGHAAINCRIVDAGFLPCLPYLTQGGSPSTPCCIGIESIKTMTISAGDKRAVCNCVKTAANRYPSLKDDAAQTLPDKFPVKLIFLFPGLLIVKLSTKASLADLLVVNLHANVFNFACKASGFIELHVS